MTRLPAPIFALVLALLVTISPAALALCLTAGPFNTANICWNPVNPVPDTFSFEFVTWNPDRAEYIAIGEGGAILTSPNGIDWTPRNSGTVQELYSALWDGSRYVVVGEGGLVLTSSPDAAIWTPQITNTRLALFDIAWNGAVYVAVGQNGALLTSSDAVDWTAKNISISASGALTVSAGALGAQRGSQPLLRGITWANGRFVAVGSSGTIISSANGSTWAVHKHTSCSTPCDAVTLRDIAVNSQGRFVAVGENGTVYVSDDPGTSASWSLSTIFGHPNARLHGIAWSGSQFVAVGDDGTGSSPLVLSGQPDGLNWSADNTISAGTLPQTLRSVSFGGTTFIAVGAQTILSGVPASTWAPLAADPAMTRALNDILRTDTPNPRYFAVGANGALLTSTNGFAWSAQPDVATALNGRALNGITWNGSGNTPVIVAVGADGVIITSNNGVDWSLATTTVTDAQLFDVTYGNNRFIAVGAGGALATSTDGSTWSLAASGVATDLQGVTWSGSAFVAVGFGGAITTSGDGVAWTPRISGITGQLNAVAWGNGRFVAVGAAGTGPTAAVIRTSTDGIDWDTAIFTSGNSGLQDVAWNGNQFMAASDSSSFMRSTDGRTWTGLGIGGGTAQLNAINWDGAHFLAVGNGGAIYNSGGVDIVIALDVSNPDDVPTSTPASKLKTFRFNIANIGNVDAPTAQFLYSLPTGFSFPTADPPIVGTSCSVPGGINAQCNLGRQIAGTGDSISVSVNVIADSAGSVPNSATIDSPDANPANNQISFTTVVGAAQGPVLPSPDVTPSGGALNHWTLLLLTLLACRERLRRLAR